MADFVKARRRNGGREMCRWRRACLTFHSLVGCLWDGRPPDDAKYIQLNWNKGIGTASRRQSVLQYPEAALEFLAGTAAAHSNDHQTCAPQDAPTTLMFVTLPSAAPTGLFWLLRSHLARSHD